MEEQLGVLITALQYKKGGFFLLEANERNLREDLVVKLKTTLTRAGKTVGIGRFFPE